MPYRIDEASGRLTLSVVSLTGLAQVSGCGAGIRRAPRHKTAGSTRSATMQHWSLSPAPVASAAIVPRGVCGLAAESN
jgi:hypothetical protein